MTESQNWIWNALREHSEEIMYTSTLQLSFIKGRPSRYVFLVLIYVARVQYKTGKTKETGYYSLNKSKNDLKASTSNKFNKAFSG
jgi:hypothetical protein